MEEESTVRGWEKVDTDTKMVEQRYFLGMPVERRDAFSLWVDSEEESSWDYREFEDYRLNSSQLTFTDPQYV